MEMDKVILNPFVDRISKACRDGLMKIRPMMEKHLRLDHLHPLFEKDPHLFTRQELENIYKETGQYRQTRTLVLSLQKKSVHQISLFTEVLSQAGYQDITTVIQGFDKATHSFETGSDMECRQTMSQENRLHLCRMRPELEKTLQMESLVSEFHQHAESGFLTDEEEDEIMRMPTGLAQTHHFINILMKKGNTAYSHFVKTLQTHHYTVVPKESKPERKSSRHSIECKNSTGIDSPLSEARKKALSTFNCFTKEVLYFISCLHEATGGFLSSHEEETILQQQAEKKRVLKLIDTLKKKDSSRAFDHFVQVLRSNGMSSDVNILFDWERINNSPGSTMQKLPEAHDLIDEYIDLKGNFVAAVKAADTSLWYQVRDYVVDRLYATASISSKHLEKLDEFKVSGIDEGARMLFFTFNNWFGFKLLLLVLNRFHSEFRMLMYHLDRFKEKLKPLLESKLSQVEEIRCIFGQEADTPEGCERMIMRLGLDHKEMTVNGLLEAKDFIARELQLSTTALDEFQWARSSVLFYFTISAVLASPVDEQLQDPVVQQNLSNELNVDMVLVGNKPTVVRGTPSKTTKEEIGRTIYMAAKKKSLENGFQEFIIDKDDARQFFTKELKQVSGTYTTPKNFTFHINATNESAVKREWEREREAERRLQSSKVTTGAVVGTALLPVLGTVIGAGVGYLVGKKLTSSDSIPEVKKCQLTITAFEALNQLPQCTVFGDNVYL